MKSRVIGVLFLLFTIVCCSCVAPVAQHPDADTLDSEVVALVGPGDEGSLYVFCTATWISDDLILTAAHCAKAWEDMGADPAYSTQKEAGDISRDITRSHPLVIVAVDEVVDLALLRAPKPTGHKAIDLALFAPEEGDHVFIVGHPGGLVWTHTEGEVAAYRTMSGPFPIEGHFMQVSGPIWYGNSGGPCVNADGELVGVASFMSKAPPSTGFFVALRPIQKFLLKNKVL